MIAVLYLQVSFDDQSTFVFMNSHKEPTLFLPHDELTQTELQQIGGEAEGHFELQNNKIWTVVKIPIQH